MPTYLFAIAVSEYSFVEADGTLYRLPIRVASIEIEIKPQS